MAKKKNPPKKSKPEFLPGISLEMNVARIQQMMDPNSTVTHNEHLTDRVGNKRQYDVVIRGKFGGRSILGVIECKDHNRRKGPSTVEAFAKKTENLNANLKLMVSKKGFTKQALSLARHEGISCLSLLPEDPKLTDFTIGDVWYGVIYMWLITKFLVNVVDNDKPADGFDIESVTYEGKPVIHWFRRELSTTYKESKDIGVHSLTVSFDTPRQLSINGRLYNVDWLACDINRTCQKKKKWVSWSGDALYDWDKQQYTIPPKGVIVGSSVESDLSKWDDLDGEIPEPVKAETLEPFEFHLHVIQYNFGIFTNYDSECIDLTSLGLAVLSTPTAIVGRGRPNRVRSAPHGDADSSDTPDPVLGCMRDDAELMDEIVADAYRLRREETWRKFDL